MEVALLFAAVGGVFGQLADYGHLAGHIFSAPTGLIASSGLIMLTAAALSCVLAGFLAHGARVATATAIPLRSRATALRAQSPPDRLPAAARSRARPAAAGPEHLTLARPPPDPAAPLASLPPSADSTCRPVRCQAQGTPAAWPFVPGRAAARR